MNSTKTLSVVVLLLAALWTPVAQARGPRKGTVHYRAPRDTAASQVEDPDRRPGSGLAGRIVGGIGLAVAALNLVMLSVCESEDYPDESRETCRTGSLASAGVFGTIGVLSLAVGLSKKAAYKEWLKRHRYGGLESITPVVRRDRAGLQLRMRF